MIEQHSGGAPLFIYLAFQSIHSPIEAPEEWVAPYDWITDLSRRKMAGMATCMDAEIARIKDAMVAKQFWDDTCQNVQACGPSHARRPLDHGSVFGYANGPLDL